MLTTCTSSLICIYTQILLLYLYLYIIVFWCNINTREACMSSLIGIERRYTYEPMNTYLRLKIAKWIFTIYAKHNTFYTCLLIPETINSGNRITITFQPPHIHTKKHLRPVTGIGTTC